MRKKGGFFVSAISDFRAKKVFLKIKRIFHRQFQILNCFTK